MKYKGYSAANFANDSFFIRWVRNPDEESDWFWESFIKENPACKREIEVARELVSVFDFPEHPLEEEEMAAIKNRLLMTLKAEKEADRDNVSIQTSWLEKKGYRLLKLAAAILIVPLFTAGLFLFMDKHKDGIGNRAERGNRDFYEERINPSGQKSVLFLADGTRVWLNSASKITYAKTFIERGTRDVYLEGEAFFDVAHNKEKPFIVHTSFIKIRVLGTSFNVKSYSNEKTVETTLVRGKVIIESPDNRGTGMKDIELKPNQRAVFNKKSKIINIKEVVSENSAAWRQERMVFDAEPIDNVILQMERWYDVKIHVENKGELDCKLTATIENESLEEVLKLFEASHDIEYEIDGNEVFIEGTLCETD